MRLVNWANWKPRRSRVLGLTTWNLDFLDMFRRVVVNQDVDRNRFAVIIFLSTAQLKMWLQLRFDYYTTTIRLRRDIGCKPISQLRFDYDATTIRRYQDAFDYDGSDRNYDLRSLRLRYDYDPTTTYRARLHASIRRDSMRAKMNMSIFRRSCVVVIS